MMAGKKFNAFEGRRYFDYDNLSMKKILFHNRKFVKCKICKKRIKIIQEGFYVYNMLLCKKCCSEFSEKADKELDKALGEFF